MLRKKDDNLGAQYDRISKRHQLFAQTSIALETHTTTTITLVHDCKIHMVYCDINYKLNIACEQKESKRKFL